MRHDSPWQATLVKKTPNQHPLHPQEKQASSCPSFPVAREHPPTQRTDGRALGSEGRERSASDFCQHPAKFGHPDLRAHGKTRELESRRNEEFREQLSTIRNCSRNTTISGVALYTAPTPSIQPSAGVPSSVHQATIGSIGGGSQRGCRIRTQRDVRDSGKLARRQIRVVGETTTEFCSLKHV